MTDQSRREFLTKLAQGSIYVAPIVATLLAPKSVTGQGPSQKMMMMMMMGMMAGQQRLPDAPWFKPPPGSPPGSTPGR